MNLADFDAEDARLSDAIKGATEARNAHRRMGAEALTAHLREATGKPWTAIHRRGRWGVFLREPRIWISRTRRDWVADILSLPQKERHADLLTLCRMVAP